MSVRACAGLAVLALTSLAAPALANAAPRLSAGHAVSLTLSRTTALPGTAVTFHGTHFRPHEKVALHWASTRGATIATTKASGAGVISGHFAVPNPNGKAPVSTSVVAVGSIDHQAATAKFRQMCTDEWVAKGGGDWSVARDWSIGAIPGSADIACITRIHKANYTVTLSAKTGSTSVGALLLGSPTGARIEALKILPSGSDLHLALGASGLIEPHGQLVLANDSSGGSTFIDGGPLVNDGGITTPGSGWSRYFTDSVINAKTGTFVDNNRCTGACDVYFNGTGGLTNSGKLTVDSAATVITNDAAITQNSGSVSNAGTMILNAGTLTLNGGAATGHTWLLRNNVTLDDRGATGVFTFQDGGTFNGNVPAGQTLTVDGDAGNDVKLAVPATFSNDGTINLTSDSAYNGPTNSWLVPQTTTPSTLTNNGLLETTGSGFSRYLLIDVENTASGQVVLGDAGGNNYLTQAQGDGSTTFTNDGSLTIADGADFLLAGTSYGQADFVQGGSGILDVTNDTTHSTASVIHQTGCSAAGCQQESVLVGGTVTVTTVGSAAAFVPVYSDAYAIDGTFNAVTGSPSYVASTNQPDATLSNPPGDVILTPAG